MLALHAFKCIEEFVEAHAVLKIRKQRFDRHARAEETRRAAQPLRVSPNGKIVESVASKLIRS